MTAVLGLELCPLYVPWPRRLQTLAVAHYLFLFFVSPWLCLGVPLYILSSWAWWWWLLGVAYVIWYVRDFDGPRRGSHRSDWFRRLSIFRYFADYFPVKLIKTAELDPGRNYILGYHPHGIGCIGAFLNFATEATGFSQLFPGISTSLCTLASNFYVPFRREYYEWLGIVDVSKESIEYLLSSPEKHQAVVIVPGGAAEALYSRPGDTSLVLRNRKGFVRLALQQGADLVPVYSFGETDLYNQVNNPEGSHLRAFQNKFKSLAGFSPPLFHGRGMFNYTFGPMPYRRPITTVVGKPIRVEKCENPTAQQIDELHSKYVDTLTALFDDHKLNYGFSETQKLVIL